MASQSSFTLILVLMFSRDLGSVSLSVLAHFCTSRCDTYCLPWQDPIPLLSRSAANFVCLFLGWLLVLRSGIPSPENTDTSNPYNFNWLPPLVTCPHTGTLVWHAHWQPSRTESSNSRFTLQCAQQGRDIRELKSACRPSDLLCELGFGTVPLIWLMDDFFVWLPQPNGFYIWCPPSPRKMISFLDCRVERLRSAFADVSGLYGEFGWVTFLSLGAFLNHRFSIWRLSKESCRRTEIPASDKHLI